MAKICSSLGFLGWIFCFLSFIVWSKACTKVGPCDCSRGSKPTIDCSNRKLTKFPNISNFPEETISVNIEGNILNQIDLDDNVELKKVETLNLDKNYLIDVDIEKITRSFPSLSNLALRDNIIEHLKNAGRVEIESILDINIGNNSLQSISELTFSGLLHLKFLHLDYNRIHVIHKKAFASLYNLKFLWLQFNQLLVVQSSWFRDLNSLETLDLSNNKISQFLPEGKFVWPPSLYELNLNRNSMKILPPLPHGPKKNARIEDWNVDIQNNPLYCGCRSPGYSLSSLKTIPFCNIKLVCTSPTKMAHQSVTVDEHAKEGCSVSLKKSFWKVYMKMEACFPPRITKFETDIAVDNLLCAGRGKGKITMQILYLTTNQIIKTLTQTVNSTAVIEIGTTLMKQVWIRCLIKSDQGKDFKDIFLVQAALPEENQTLCVRRISVYNKTFGMHASSEKTKLNNVAGTERGTVFVNILGIVVASICFFICALLILFAFLMYLPKNEPIEELDDLSTGYIYLY